MKVKPKTVGMYGPGIIGQSAYDKVKHIQKKKPLIYGPGILGEKEYAEALGELEPVEVPDIEPETEETGPPSPPPLETDADVEALIEEYKAADGYVSVKDLKAMLKKMPTAFDRLFGWELERKDGPRIGALSHLLERELEREDGPRPIIQDVIEKTLVELRT